MLLSKYANITISDTDGMVPFERNRIFELLCEHNKEIKEETEKAKAKSKSKSKKK